LPISKIIVEIEIGVGVDSCSDWHLALMDRSNFAAELCQHRNNTVATPGFSCLNPITRPFDTETDSDPDPELALPLSFSDDLKRHFMSTPQPTIPPPISRSNVLNTAKAPPTADLPRAARLRVPRPLGFRPKGEGQRFAARLGVPLHGGRAPPVRGRRSAVGGAKTMGLRTISLQMRRS
jgi:hypothetical protein